MSRTPTTISGSTVALSAIPLAVNYLGLCAITMPVGRDRAGMPVGLQLTAPAYAEERLLAIAQAAERVLGTAADRLGTPPLLAA